MATDTLTFSTAPVMYLNSGRMGGGFNAETENSAVNFSKVSVPPLYKNQATFDSDMAGDNFFTSPKIPPLLRKGSEEHASSDRGLLQGMFS